MAPCDSVQCIISHKYQSMVSYYYSVSAFAISLRSWPQKLPSRSVFLFFENDIIVSDYFWIYLQGVNCNFVDGKHSNASLECVFDFISCRRRCLCLNLDKIQGERWCARGSTATVWSTFYDAQIKARQTIQLTKCTRNPNYLNSNVEHMFAESIFSSRCRWCLLLRIIKP